MKKLLYVLMFGMIFGQTEWMSKVYQVDWNGNDGMNIDDLVGENVGNGWVEIINIDVQSLSCNGGNNYTVLTLSSNIYGFQLSPKNEQNVQIDDWPGNMIRMNNDKVRFTDNESSISIVGSHHCDFNGTLSLLVTAEFPQEDTGYIEDGFEYCISAGSNLVSSPCRDEIAITDALPIQITSNLTGIITEAESAIQVNGQWFGSLDNLNGRRGYWFKSEKYGCFNYSCTEN